MKSIASTARQQTARVLIISHPDGYLELFADQTIDAQIERVPVAHSRAAERVADECVDLMLPARCRPLHRADYLRAVGSTRPLCASAMQESAFVKELLAVLNNLSSEAEEVCSWTL